MGNIIQVKLSKNTSPNYADPNDVIVYDGDQIQFTAVDADFKVTFKDASTIMDISESSKVYEIIIGTSKLTETFKVPFTECNYTVERISLTQDLYKAPAKMTVKAVIKRIS